MRTRRSYAEEPAVLTPKDATIRFDLGTLLANTGQTAAAIRQLDVAERIHPSDPATHNELSLLFEKTGDKETGSCREGPG